MTAADTSVIPEGWEVTWVDVIETTSYSVPVAHPIGASDAHIGYMASEVYDAADHPAEVFAHEPGQDEYWVQGEELEFGHYDEPEWSHEAPATDELLDELARREDPDPATVRAELPDWERCGNPTCVVAVSEHAGGVDCVMAACQSLRVEGEAGQSRHGRYGR